MPARRVILLPFSYKVPGKVKRAHPADPVPQFNHKHDLRWLAHCSGAEQSG
ncbi:Hypothetical protein SMAX5B_017486 [Scophthalmus maximus]|uniref:Uncharacterized protein n=1 Tax=Scophthalmus maximus TaxID=52904 RepID=A0A2U9CPY1_SCOMX|nr:Hypothetical protein SMAX5B_017486 [Scophthalmus maximus]